MSGECSKLNETEAAIREQIELNRDNICHDRIEQLTVTLKYRPHGGGVRSVSLACLNVFDNDNGKAATSRREA